VTVSCVPGGYASGGNGTSASYSGLDLAMGNPPTIGADGKTKNTSPRDPTAPVDDGKLDFLPYSLLALMAAFAGIALGIWIRGDRRPIMAAWALLTTILLIDAQSGAIQRIATRVTQDLAQPLPPGHPAASYVNTSAGFLLASLLALGTALGNLASLAWTWRRTRQALH
jgi:hypothetical protein